MINWETRVISMMHLRVCNTTTPHHHSRRIPPPHPTHLTSPIANHCPRVPSGNNSQMAPRTTVVLLQLSDYASNHTTADQLAYLLYSERLAFDAAVGEHMMRNQRDRRTLGHAIEFKKFEMENLEGLLHHRLYLTEVLKRRLRY